MNHFDSAKRFFAVFGAVLLAACSQGVAGEDEADTVENAVGETRAQGPGKPVPAAQRAAAAKTVAKKVVFDEATIVLPYTWEGQPNGYFCGPGSTKMALSTRMEEPPTQATLAKAMGTTTNGTDHIGLPTEQLNKYLKPETPYVPRMVDWVATPAQTEQLRTDILARIGSGFPLVANVVSGWRPPGYPSGTIYHYVAVVGYDAESDLVLIADPAAEGSAGPRWENVPRTYWVALPNLARWIGGKGYTG